jgi:hypothetical protein
MYVDVDWAILLRNLVSVAVEINWPLCPIIRLIIDRRKETIAIHKTACAH